MKDFGFELPGTATITRFTLTVARPATATEREFKGNKAALRSRYYRTAQDVPVKVWVAGFARRANISLATIYNRLSRGIMKYPPGTRFGVTGRAIFVPVKAVEELSKSDK